MPGRSFARMVLAAALTAGGACEKYGPDTVPKDPGTVMAFVTDVAGAPIAGVWVYVDDLPNSVGSTFSEGQPTNATGIVRFEYIPAGQRRVEVKPPAAYTADALVTPVDVIKGATVAVRFTLTSRLR